MQIYAEHFIDGDWTTGNTAVTVTGSASEIINALFEDWTANLPELNQRRKKSGREPIVGLPLFKKTSVRLNPGFGVLRVLDFSFENLFCRENLTKPQNPNPKPRPRPRICGLNPGFVEHWYIS
jgi:hypothetical protein